MAKRKRAGSAEMMGMDDAVTWCGAPWFPTNQLLFWGEVPQKGSVNRRALRNYAPDFVAHPSRPRPGEILSGQRLRGGWHRAWTPRNLLALQPEFTEGGTQNIALPDDPTVRDNFRELEEGWEGSYRDPNLRARREGRRAAERRRDYGLLNRARRLNLGQFVRDRARYLVQRPAAPPPRLTPAESFHANRVRAAAGVTPFPLPEGAWARSRHSRRHYLDARDRHRETAGGRAPTPTRPATRRRKAARPVKRARG